MAAATLGGVVGGRRLHRLDEVPRLLARAQLLGDVPLQLGARRPIAAPARERRDSGADRLGHLPERGLAPPLTIAELRVLDGRDVLLRLIARTHAHVDVLIEPLTCRPRAGEGRDRSAHLFVDLQRRQHDVALGFAATLARSAHLGDERLRRLERPSMRDQRGLWRPGAASDGAARAAAPL